MKPDPKPEIRQENGKRPYRKPRIIEERKLEALAVVCGGLFDQKQKLGQYNGQGYCTSLFS
ncbi:MAG: hypothetical protein ACYS8W_08860 [Planctomycetota bacterium]|jgi:hypothetical protein